MSQKVTTRKGAINEEKEKRQTDSPVKETKKKMAVTVEKEKQAAEKAEKSEKQAEKNAEKSAEKKDKSADKKDTHAEKPKEDGSKGEKSGKTDKQDNKHKSNKVHNGVCDVTLSTNGGAEELNGAASPADDDDDVLLVIDDEPRDELFPELAYDTSDTECEHATDAPSRSITRRSQVKSTRTPETPRPASDKQNDKDTDENKDSKVLKLKEDAQCDRKLRSSDSPKPDSKKTQETKKTETKEPEKEEKKPEEQPKEQEKIETVKEQEKVELSKEKEKLEPAKEQEKERAPVAEVQPETKESDKSEENKTTLEKLEMEVVIEVETDEEPRKTDTNYSKSRVKVSPYRRSLRLADQTTSSVMANYTGNNTTMEMDITETSMDAEESALDRSFLRGIRNIRGRNSYKQLEELNLKHLTNRTARPNLNASSRDIAREVRETRETRESREVVECVSRPTAPVVGRKRAAAAGDHARDNEPNEPTVPAPKRGRLLHRIAHTFRRNDIGTQQIVGINTDLPLTAPVASADTFDPERLKAEEGVGGVGGVVTTAATAATDTHVITRHPSPLATPLGPHETRDNKRCLIM